MYRPELAVTGFALFGLSMAVGWWLVAATTIVFCGILLLRLSKRVRALR